MTTFPIYEMADSSGGRHGEEDLSWVFTTISSIPNTPEYKPHLEMLYAIVLHHDVKLTNGVSLSELPFSSTRPPGRAKGLILRGDKIPRALLFILSRYLLAFSKEKFCD